MGVKANLINVNHLKKQFIGGNGQMYSKQAIMNIIDDEPLFNGKETEFGEWDILVVKTSMDRWQAHAQCSCCSAMIPFIWEGYFPDIPDTMARHVTEDHAKRVRLDKYCRECGARMDGGDNDEAD